jgi:hypothetical protein
MVREFIFCKSAQFVCQITQRAINNTASCISATFIALIGKFEHLIAQTDDFAKIGICDFVSHSNYKSKTNANKEEKTT